MVACLLLSLAAGIVPYLVEFPEGYPGGPPGEPALWLDAVSVPLPEGAPDAPWVVRGYAEGEPTEMPAQASRLGPWSGGRGWIAFLRGYESHGEAVLEPTDTAVEWPFAEWELVDDGGAVTFRCDGRPRLRYVYRPVLPEGVPERFRRSSYIHPVWSPSGAVLTDDFPADHYHHSGIFWRWPSVVWRGRLYNHWDYNGGMKTEFEAWLGRETGPICAVLGVRNGWYVEGERVAVEEVWIRAWPQVGMGYPVDVTVRLRAEEPGLTIGGEPLDGKGYGGFSIRFAPREEGVIALEEGPQSDRFEAPSPWCDYSGVFGGELAGIATFLGDEHPGQPAKWFLRPYGCYTVSWPGLGTAEVPAEEFLELPHRLWVHDGDRESGGVAEAYESWRTLQGARLRALK